MLEMRSVMTRSIRECQPLDNAYEIFHKRDVRRRHLIRLWLRNDELAWTTPKPLESTWKKLYSVEPDQQRFPLNPEIRRRADGVAK
jgi:hypothetical protein